MSLDWFKGKSKPETMVFSIQLIMGVSEHRLYSHPGLRCGNFQEND